MKKIIARIINSTKYSLHGLHKAYLTDKSFNLDVKICSIILVIVIYLLWPITETQFLFLFLSYFLVLIVELVNTSIEEMLDKLHPEKNEMIGLSKDIASAAVFLSIMLALVVVLVIALGKFGYSPF